MPDRPDKTRCDEPCPTAERRCGRERGHAGDHGYRVVVDTDRADEVTWADSVDRSTLHTHDVDCCWNCHRGRATHPEGNDQACASRGHREKPKP